MTWWAVPTLRAASSSIRPQPARGTWRSTKRCSRTAVDGGVATLRFYQWSEPTLSLGYFQRYDDRHQHAASRKCAVVRRQSGGGAILHDRELTYSLTLPASHPLTRDATALYTAVHNAFIQALAPRLPVGRTCLATATQRQRIAAGSERRAVPLLPASGLRRLAPCRRSGARSRRNKFRAASV